MKIFSAKTKEQYPRSFVMIANCHYDVIKTGKNLFKDCKNANDFEVDEIGENKDENCNRIICCDYNTNNPWFKLKGTDANGSECYFVAHDRADGCFAFLVSEIEDMPDYRLYWTEEFTPNQEEVIKL